MRHRMRACDAHRCYRLVQRAIVYMTVTCPVRHPPDGVPAGGPRAGNFFPGRGARGAPGRAPGAPPRGPEIRPPGGPKSGPFWDRFFGPFLLFCIRNGGPGGVP